MGGGRGTRMHPLTKYRSKPAVPFGGRYRLIDVPISNCLTSGFNKILVLTQYNSESLNKHIFRTYKLDTFFKGYVEILAAEQSYERTDWFQGTADSVRRSLPHVHDPNLDTVIVLSGDQLYSLDLAKLQEEHCKRNADITICCASVPENQVSRFGIMGVGADNKITSFLEKPKQASLIKESPVNVHGKPHYLASAGIYIFKKNVLADILKDTSQVDFGKEVIPQAIGQKKVHAYVMTGYWSDIGDIASYYEANLMLADPEPSFDLYNEDWQIYTRPRYLPPAKMQKCTVERSIIAEGCMMDEVAVVHSVVGIRSRISSGTRIEDSILNGNDYYNSTVGIGKNCLIRKAIIDKNVSIGNNVRIVNEKKHVDADGELYTIRDGIVVVHKGATIPDNTVI